MQITAAQPQDVTEIIKSGIAYDSYKYVKSDGTIEWVDIFGQQAAYEISVGKIVEEKTFDVIHAHDWLSCRAAMRAKQKSGKPLILHMHSIESDRSGKEHGGNPLVREIEYTALHVADKIIAVSEHTKKSIIREYHVPADKIEVVHNSMDISEMAPLSGDNAYAYLTKMKGQGYRVVTFIGRLTIQKGIVNLLHAAQKVVQHSPKTLFLIVGSGEQYYELLGLSAQLGIAKNVVFTEFQRGKNWRDAYAIGDLFVMPSISEPFGLTPLEAIGYGTPALISKQSGVAEVLQNALKVDFWDIDEMANQISAVMDNDALRDELHRNSLLEYSRLSWNDAADKLFSVYDHHLKAAAV